MSRLISVIIPAYNEGSTVASTVRAARAGVVACGFPCEVLVVDDGSVDTTAQAAEAAGARVVSLGRRSGKGAALTEGVWQTTGDVVAFLDADLGDSASEVEKLIAPVVRGEVDMTIARFRRTRRGTAAGGFGIVKGMAKTGIRCLAGLWVSAPLSGQRAARRDVVLALTPFESGFGVEVGMTIDAARRGYRIAEVDCEMSHRATGRDFAGFLHRGRQLYWVTRALACRALRVPRT
ncbi:MAG: glycosyltransferase family 2 protein [Firmicutes bacterium]|nr:glycosyltransferase family 2 protein [Bacillota bacterium]MDH7495629.1 glycosyltransferase family 2 protein [Bacillota bacterium]